MTLATRLTLAMTGLVLLTATALGLLAFRNAEISMQLAGLAAVAAALLLAVLAARALTRPLARMAHAAGTMSIDSKPMTRISESGEIGRLARAFDRLADEMRDRSAQLEHESSKRRTTEAELEQYRQQERMFAAAVESANYPVITKTLDGTITAWNPAAARLYQYPVSEAIGRNIAFIVPPDRRSEHSEIVKRVLAAEPIESFETVRVARDGRRIDVSLSFYPIKSSSGEIVALAAITRDITAQKSAEEKFRLAVESCPSGMVMVDRTGRIVMVNTEVERLFAYQRDELIGQPIEILVPERFHAEHVSDRDAFATAPENRRMGAERKLFGRRKDGVEIPVEVSLNPIHTREGVLILSVIVDVSERQRAQELFRLAVEACPSGMVMIDRTGRIVMVNTEIERLFGYRRDELIGMPVETLVPPASALSARRPPDRLYRPSRNPAHGRRSRLVRVSQGRHGISGRGRAQSHPCRRKSPGPQRDRRHQRAQAPRAPEGRIRLDREPRVAHAADLDRRLARPARSAAPPARCPIRPRGCSRSLTATASGWCG